MQELHLDLDRTIAALSQELGRPPRPSEIAARAGVRDEEVLEAMEATRLYRLSSLDTANADEDPSTDRRIAEVDVELDAIEDRLAVADLLGELEPRERTIIYLRFFEGLTQAEIADEVGISQMHVSRLLTRSLETLSQHPSLAGGA